MSIPGPLNEGARSVVREHAVFVLQVPARKRTQCAVIRLRPRIDIHIHAVPRRIARDGTVLRTRRTGNRGGACASYVPSVVSLDVAAELQTGVRARDVVITFTI